MKFVAIRKPDGSTDKYAVRSECGRYTVAKVIVWAQVFYQSWYVTSSSKAEMLGLPVTDPAEAKQRCADHAAQLKAAA